MSDTAVAGPVERLWRTIETKLRYSATAWPYHLAFAAVWAPWIAACVAWHFTEKGWAFDNKLQTVVLIYAAGSFAGGFLANWLAMAFSGGSRPTVRFSLHLVLVAFLTLGFVVLFFMLQYRIYFSQWHHPFPSITWMFQAFFTALGSIFLFLLTGLRPLLPWGVLGLLLASTAFSRGWLHHRR